MKNLLANLGKTINPKNLSNLPKRIKRWNLLLVDDHGKVISFQHIKVLVIIFLIMFLISLFVSISLLFLNNNSKNKIVELQNTLDMYRQDADARQQEISSLMVCLAEAQSERPKNAAQKSATVSRNSSSTTEVTKFPELQPVKAGTDRPQKTESIPSKALIKESAGEVSAKSSDQAGTQRTEINGQKDPPTQHMMKMEVGIFDFSAVHDSELNVLNVQFIIKNINRNISDISGYIFVVMKEDEQDQINWFSIPGVKLISGKPAVIKAGHFFKIRNYKTVNVRSDAIVGPKTFKKVSVLIYSPAGELLLEKTYRVNIDVAGNSEKIPTKITAPEPPPAEPVIILQEQDEAPLENRIEASPEFEKNDTEEIIQKEVQEKNPGTEISQE